MTGPASLNWGPMWARGRCRISPPRFLGECCNRQLNQGCFVLLYFRLFTFSDLCWVCIFLYCFVCQKSVKWLAVKTASEMTSIVLGGALNSTQTKPNCNDAWSRDISVSHGRPWRVFSIMTNVTWQRFDQSAKQLAVIISLYPVWLQYTLISQLVKIYLRYTKVAAVVELTCQCLLWKVPEFPFRWTRRWICWMLMETYICTKNHSSSSSDVSI